MMFTYTIIHAKISKTMRFNVKLSTSESMRVKLGICNSIEPLGGILFCDWYKRILNFQSSYLGVIDSFTCRTVEEGHIMIFRGARWLRLKKRNTKNKSSIYKINKSLKSLLISVLKKKLFQIHLQKKKRDF